MDGTTVLIIILAVILINGLLARHFGHHVYTMVTGVIGFGLVYFYSFWYQEEMGMSELVLIVFFFLVFAFGRIKHHLQLRKAKEKDE